jgi:hypothetical protein
MYAAYGKFRLCKVDLNSWRLCSYLKHKHTWCFRKSFTTLKPYINLFRGHVRVLNCHNVAKHIEFYLVYLLFNVASTSNAGCFEKSFRMVFQMLVWRVL